MNNIPAHLNPDSDRGMLTRKQIERLLRAIEPNHVDKKQSLSYMAQHEVRAEMTRIFGFGNWDSQVEQMQFVTEWERGDSGAKTNPKTGQYFVAIYRAAVRLNIRDYWGRPVCSFVEWHSEANSPLPDRGEAHAMAITSVESYALRRAAIGLGDRLGLGLYDNGKTTALVRGTLQITGDSDSPHFTEPVNDGNEEGTPAPPAQNTGRPDIQGAFNQAAGPANG